LINHLDRVLRSAARLIGWVSKFDHISAYMQNVLHWLPLGIEYGILCGWPFGMEWSPIGSLVTS